MRTVLPPVMYLAAILCFLRAFWSMRRLAPEQPASTPFERGGASGEASPFVANEAIRRQMKYFLAAGWLCVIAASALFFMSAGAGDSVTP
jgi:hypothetical protein